MSLPDSLIGDDFTEVIARRILPLLVWCARSCRTMTYGEVDAEVVRRRWGKGASARAYQWPLGAIGDALIETGKERQTQVPPLNALVVNRRTGLPGHGFDYYMKRFVSKKHRSRKLSEADRKAIVGEIHQEIYSFHLWEEILEEYGLKPLKDKPKRKLTRRKKKRYGWSSEGESDEHEALKKYVALHPSVVNLSRDFFPGEEEYVFPSADRADVLFGDGRDLIAVEVKAGNSNDDDLKRGIFQCVKYQALLRAEQKVDKDIPNGRAVLVTARTLPKNLRKTAKLLDVSVFRVAV